MQFFQCFYFSRTVERVIHHILAGGQVVRPLPFAKKRGENSPFCKKTLPFADEKNHSPRINGYGENALILVAVSGGAAKACCAALLGLKGQCSMRRLGIGPAIRFTTLGSFAAKGCSIEELHFALIQIFASGIQFKKVFLFLAQHGRRFPGCHVLFQGKDGSRARDRRQLGSNVPCRLQACL